MAWAVRLSRDAEKQFAHLPRDRREIVAAAIDRMKQDPFQGNVKSLKGKEWRGRFRKAVGRYRIIFLPDYEQRRIEISAILVRTERTYG